MRWVENPRDATAAFRVLQLLPGIGPGSARKALTHLSDHAFEFSALSEFQPPAAIPIARRAVEDSLTLSPNYPSAPGPMLVGHLQQARLKLPTMIHMSIDRMYELGEPSGPTMIQMVGVAIQYTELLDETLSEIIGLPLDKIVAKLEPLLGHLSTIAQLVEAAYDGLEAIHDGDERAV